MNDGITAYKGQWYNPLNKIIIITKAQMNTDLYFTVQQYYPNEY